MSRPWILTCVLLLTSGCATLHDGERAPQTPLGLVASAREVKELASQHFGMLELTLENRSTRWLRMTKVALDLGNEG